MLKIKALGENPALCLPSLWWLPVIFVLLLLPASPQFLPPSLHGCLPSVCDGVSLSVSGVAGVRTHTKLV